MFGHLISAICTPFDEDNKIDFDTFLKLLKKVEENHTTVVIGGSTGEGHSLTIKEKEELVIFCLKNTKLKIILGISEANTEKAIEEVRYFSYLDIKAYLVMCPSVYLPSQVGLYHHFKEIADHSYKIPIIIYNVPKRSGVSLKEITLRKLINACPNIIGIKDTTNDINLIKLIKEKYPKFLFYIGNDSFFYKGIEAGADGIISVMSIEFGKQMHYLIEDFKYGFYNSLLDNYLKLVAELLSLESNPMAIKYYLSKVGYRSMNLRLPLVELSIESQKQIDVIL